MRRTLGRRTAISDVPHVLNFLLILLERILTILKIYRNFNLDLCVVSHVLVVINQKCPVWFLADAPCAGGCWWIHPRLTGDFRVDGSRFYLP